MINVKKLHQKVSKEMKRRALSFEASQSEELSSYQREQSFLSKRVFKKSTSKKLIEKAKNSDFIFVGDFHTFEQSQKNALRFLNLLLKEKKNISLGLEMISAKNQVFIDAYLNNSLTEREFLEAIDYYETWSFPWSHYKSFFKIAKKHQLPIIALNSQGSLSQRDLFASEILANQKKLQPKKTYFVLFGELHILPPKLPKKLKEKLNLKNLDSFLIVHQNLDSVFWKLYDEPLNKDHIVSFAPNEFSINNSPPWVKYESMIYWYEHLMDDPAFNLHEYIVETGLKTFGGETQDSFLAISEELNRLFALKISKENLENFDLHDHKKLDYLTTLAQESAPTKNLLQFYLNLMGKNISFTFYHNNDYYCSNYNLNRLTSLAGIHLFHSCIGERKPHYIKKLFFKKAALTERFFFFCYEKMFAYLCSKVFNPYIKCDLYKNLLTQSPHGLGEKITAILDSPEEIENHLKGHNLTQAFLMARVIGEFLGERLYSRISPRNKENPTFNISKTFFQIPYKKEDFISLKKELLPTSLYKMQSKRKF